METVTLDRPTKCEELTQILRDVVLDGEMISGERFFSQSALQGKYSVSQNTIREAVGALVHEGLLYRKQGKGTFVAHRSEKMTACEMVGLVMRTKGHVFGELSHSLIHRLQHMGCYPVLLDPTTFPCSETGSKKLSTMVAAQPKSIVVDGDSTFQFDWLDSVKDPVDLLFIHRCEGKEHSYDADFVLSDYEFGGYLAMRHFLERGHQKLGLLTYPHIVDDVTPPSMPTNLIHRALVKGCERAIKENGLDPKENFQVIFDHEQCAESLEKCLTSDNKPSALFAFGDSRARTIYRVARKLNLTIPDDLAVLGYYDTPWADIYEPALSSISIREEKIAQLAAEIIVNREKNSSKTPAREKIYVKPELIVRDSCGTNVKH